jgi:hypothetical protein
MRGRRPDVEPQRRQLLRRPMERHGVGEHRRPAGAVRLEHRRRRVDGPVVPDGVVMHAGRRRPDPARRDLERAGVDDRNSSRVEPLVERCELHRGVVPDGRSLPAVGYGVEDLSAPAPITVPIAEVLSGGSWTLESVVGTPPGGATIQGISCPAGGYCVAVGTSDGESNAAVYVEGSEKWTYHAPPDPTTTSFTSLACGAQGCGLLGLTNLETFLAESYTASGFLQVNPALPTGAESQSLNAVSCANTTCQALGSAAPYLGSNGAIGTPQAIAQSWNGSAWTLETIQSITPGTLLTGLVCSSDSSCVAVGSAPVPGSGDIGPAFATWNGTEWSAQTLPLPIGTVSASLDDVSCVATDACYAVGSEETAGQTDPLVEYWNGSTWTVVDLPTPPALGITLSSVSCLADGGCTAVGASDDANPVPAAVVRTGAVWSWQKLALLSGGAGWNPAGVSCWADERCLTVGSESVDLGESVLAQAETQTSSTWTVVTPKSAVLGGWLGDRCAVGSGCDVVGYDQVYHYATSAWSEQAVSLASGDLESLDNLSCTTSGTCVAVGAKYSASGSVLNLATVRSSGSGS